MNVLETDRLRLRPFELADAEIAHAWFGDPLVMRHTPTGRDDSVETTRARLRAYRDHQAANGFGKWLIVDRASGAAIGDAGLLVLPDVGWIDLGFRLLPAFWRKGLATEVAAAWVTVARDQLQLAHLGAFAHPENIASIRVLERVGFAALREETVMGMPAIVFGLELRPDGRTSAPAGNPWLRIPAADYEAHMDAVGQTAALRELFARSYGDRGAARVAILGCTTGRDFDVIDPARTDTVVAIDVNPAYVARARTCARARGLRAHLFVGDILQVDLPPPGYDLIHAALLLEYVEPLTLFQRIHRWLSSAGICSLVTQEPAAGIPAVSATPYTSLRILAERMRMFSAEDVHAMAGEAHLHLRSSRRMTLPNGKTLVQSLFGK